MLKGFDVLGVLLPLIDDMVVAGDGVNKLPDWMARCNMRITMLLRSRGPSRPKKKQIRFSAYSAARITHGYALMDYKMSQLCKLDCFWSRWFPLGWSDIFFMSSSISISISLALRQWRRYAARAGLRYEDKKKVGNMYCSGRNAASSCGWEPGSARPSQKIWMPYATACVWDNAWGPLHNTEDILFPKQKHIH